MGARPPQARKDPRTHAAMRISTKVQIVMAASAAVVFTVIAVVVGLGVTDYARSLASLGAEARLDALRADLELEASRLDALTAGFAASPALYRSTIDGGATRPVSSFEQWLERQPHNRTVIWMKGDGTVLGSNGAAKDVTALGELALSRPGGARGLAALPSGTAAVAITPVTGDPATHPAGLIAVADPIETGAILTADLTTRLVRPGDADAVEDEWASIPAPAGYQGAFVDTNENLFVVQATLTGLDGRPAATVRLERPDPGQPPVARGAGPAR